MNTVPNLLPHMANVSVSSITIFVIGEQHIDKFIVLKKYIIKIM